MRIEMEQDLRLIFQKEKQNITEGTPIACSTNRLKATGHVHQI